MKTTFYEIGIGDILYYVEFENSILKTNSEIKTTTVIGAQTTNTPYVMKITLSNGTTIFANWNCYIHKVDKGSDNLYSIVRPITCTIYSTDENALKEEAINLVEKITKRLKDVQKEIHDELMTLSVAEHLAKGLETKKKEKIVLETVIV